MIGQRAMVIAWAHAVLSVIALCAAALLYVRVLLVFAPLGDYPEQTVLSRVDGIEGPAVMIGEPLEVAATKCVVGDDEVVVTGQFVWVTTGPQRRVVFGMEGNGIRAPGCVDFHFFNDMPPAITPGMWRIEGFDMARAGTREQRKAWRTEDFRVVAP